MDLDFIYTNPEWVELGYLNNCSIDLEIGKYKVATNDFEITINNNHWDKEFNKGSLFYSNNSEFGGMIKSVKVDTASNNVILRGKTFRGILEKEYIQPPLDEAYLTLKGEANKCINQLVTNCFGTLIVVDDINSSGLTINYQIRDINLLDAIERMLKQVNARIDIKMIDGVVHLKAVSIHDLSNRIQIDDSYHLSMIVEEPKNSYNHVLALGKGELTQRIRINLYRQYDGSWTDEEANNGLSRITFKYDDTNEEDLDELKKKAIEKVNEVNGSNSISVNFDSDVVELFDIVGAKEEITGIAFKESVTKKILKIKINNSISKIELEHKVGDN